MANETFNPAGASRGDFAGLFQLGAQLEAEASARETADRALSSVISQISSDLAAYDIPNLAARITALEAKLNA